MHYGVAINAWRKLICARVRWKLLLLRAHGGRIGAPLLLALSPCSEIVGMGTVSSQQIAHQAQPSRPVGAPRVEVGHFERGLPGKLRRFQALWKLLKCTCMWTIWIQRNDKVSNDQLWTDDQAQYEITDAREDFNCSIRSQLA